MRGSSVVFLILPDAKSMKSVLQTGSRVFQTWIQRSVVFLDTAGPLTRPADQPYQSFVHRLTHIYNDSSTDRILLINVGIKKIDDEIETRLSKLVTMRMSCGPTMVWQYRIKRIYPLSSGSGAESPGSPSDKSRGTRPLWRAYKIRPIDGEHSGYDHTELEIPPANSEAKIVAYRLINNFNPHRPITRTNLLRLFHSFSSAGEKILFTIADLSQAYRLSKQIFYDDIQTNKLRPIQKRLQTPAPLGSSSTELHYITLKELLRYSDMVRRLPES
jgi:hypothetical protein